MVKETSPDSADLWVVLTGGRLERHAAVSLTILNEAGQDNWAHGLTDGSARPMHRGSSGDRGSSTQAPAHRL